MKRTLSPYSHLLCALTLLICAADSPAQHATAYDIEPGEQVFERLCANCHGPDGNLIANIDLGRGVFRRDYSDAELERIILQGIEGTPMPPNPTMSPAQAQEIVAWLRQRQASRNTQTLTGNPVRGAALYRDRGECSDCHRIGTEGSGLGPDLSRIGLLRGGDELRRSLLEPDAEVEAVNRFYRVQTSDGESVSGRLLNHDTFTVLLLDREEKLRAFDKSKLREYGFIAPGMPSLRGDFNDQEIADLVAYLSSLRG